MNIDEDYADMIGKCISNDGELSFDSCKFTNPAFETLCDTLADKHVRIS